MKIGAGGLLAYVLLSPTLTTLQTTVVSVQTTGEFRAAVSSARSGTTITVAPGIYQGGSYHVNVAGTAAAPIVIRGSDRENPPVFRGGDNGIQLSDAQHVTFEDLVFEAATLTGISIDDAGTFDTPSHHITFTRVVVRDLPDGMVDGIKLAGVTDFLIAASRIERWSGAAINMVGCHRGLIRGNAFTNVAGRGGTGLSMKGGSSQIAVTDNRFDHGGARAVQIGGTTSLTLFRPQPHERAEASRITVERNVIVGSETPVTFVGSDGGVFRFNTVYSPSAYLLRILQENREAGMVPSQNGVITDNIFAWRGDVALNIGAATNAASFTFARNLWYRGDAPAGSQVALPSPEVGGVYGFDPHFSAPPADLRTPASVTQGAYGSAPASTLTR